MVPFSIKFISILILSDCLSSIILKGKLWSNSSFFISEYVFPNNLFEQKIVFNSVDILSFDNSPTSLLFDFKNVTKEGVDKSPNSFGIMKFYHYLLL